MFTKSATELISLKGKSALITGAAAGIGEAIATRFAEAEVISLLLLPGSTWFQA